MSRMLGAVPVLADAIVEQLCKASDKASDSHQQLGAQSEADADALSAAVWHSIWPVERCALLDQYTFVAWPQPPPLCCEGCMCSFLDACNSQSMVLRACN